MKVIFLADFFADQDLGWGVGGAEINDAVLIEWLKISGFLYEKKNTHLVDEEYINKNKDKIFILSNFANLKIESIRALMNKTYIIYEHDYKFLPTRNPINYPDFKAPKEHIILEDFHQCAKAIVCLSKMHREIYERNLELDNLKNINCSLFDDAKIQLLLSLSGNPKTKEYAVIDTKNPTKKRKETIEWCRQKNIEFDLISHKDNNEFLKILSQYKNLVFLTGHPEPTPRIAVEAKLMGVNLIAPKRLIGVAHEYWWPWEPKKVAQELKNIREGAFEMFRELINE